MTSHEPTTNDLEGPRLPFAASSNTTSVDSIAQEKRAFIPERHAASRPRRRWLILCGIAVGIIILALAIALPIYFVVLRPKNSLATTPSGNLPPSPSSTASVPKPTAGLITGGDGSIVKATDGTTFIYNNTFGGYWYYDPTDPLNESARPQQDVPPLNQTWKWGDDVIQGVNLGGWLVTEPFITPALYQKYPGAIDEYSLSTLMRADAAGGGINQMEEHYKTFITEQDFAQIAAAGLNWIRLPIGYWAIETWQGEPFLAKVSWQYALKAFEWARKYGLRINLDLHAVPGSQNNWWHSGRDSNQNFLMGPMGYANAQRGLDYIRIIAEFISQDQYKHVIPMFGILNEPVLPKAEVERFYYQAYLTVRAVTGLGAGHGPYISFHDGFQSLESWAGFLAGADRTMLDRHPYFAFGGPSNDPLAAYVTRACDQWASGMNTSMTAFGITNAGEWSLAINDCGLYIHGVNGAVTYPGSCAEWENWETWTPDVKENLRLLALNQMSALQNNFFWTWKVGPAQDGRIHSAFWSYQLGLVNGWMPTNPRQAAGVCTPTNPFVPGSLQPWQTGGTGAGTITSSVAPYTAWPPAGAQYLFTPNRPIPKLPSPSLPAGVDGGDGWTNDEDKTLASGPTPGCTYPSAWNEGAGGAGCTPGAAPPPTADPPPIVDPPTPEPV